MELRIFFIALILLAGCETQLEDPILEESKSSEGSLLSKAATKGKNILEDGSVYEGDLVVDCLMVLVFGNLVMRISTRGSLRRGWLMVMVPFGTNLTPIWRSMSACGQVACEKVLVPYFLLIHPSW